MNTAVITRATTGLPATILLALLLEFFQHGKASIALEDLPNYTSRGDDEIRKAVKALGPDCLGYIAIIVRERRKFVALTELMQLPLPGVENRLPEYSESPLSSSSNLTLSTRSVITTTTLTSDSEKSGSQQENVALEENVAQVRRILEATTILFDEPGVFLNGLVLETIEPDVALGWVKQGWNAKNLELCKRAGVVYNGLKSGRKPKAAFLYDGNDKLPLDYRVAIGLAEKMCPLCAQCFASLDAYDAHWKVCVQTSRESEPESDALLQTDNDDRSSFDNVLLSPGKSVNQVWGDILEILRVDLPKAAFETWVRDTLPAGWNETEILLQIGARNQYACDWLASHVKATVEKLLADVSGCAIAVEFVEGRYASQ